MGSNDRGCCWLLLLLATLLPFPSSITLVPLKTSSSALRGCVSWCTRGRLHSRNGDEINRTRDIGTTLRVVRRPSLNVGVRVRRGGVVHIRRPVVNRSRSSRSGGQSGSYSRCWDGGGSGGSGCGKSDRTIRNWSWPCRRPSSVESWQRQSIRELEFRLRIGVRVEEKIIRICKNTLKTHTAK